VADGVSRWSVWNEPRKLWFNGHHLRVGDTCVVIDPVPMTDAVVAAIEAAGAPTLCVVTNRDHERAADDVRRRWGARVLIPQADAPAMTLTGDVYGSEEKLAAELVAVAVAHAKSPGETALHWPARRILIVGDACWSRPGGLTMLPAEKYADVALARQSASALAVLDPEILLVGDGDDLLTGAADALRLLGARELVQRRQQ
jgi:glyoxylase-like metal-dependent hydrolase (beta-lactamase superfamily II)